MGILEGIFESEAAKTVADALSSAGNAAYNAGAAVGNAAYNGAAAVGNAAYNTGAAAAGMAYDAGAAVGNAAYNAGAAVVSGAAYVGSTAANLAVNSAEFAANAAYNTVTQPGATAEVLMDAARHPVNTAMLLKNELATQDATAERAHQVVNARRLLKDGMTELPEYTDLPEDVRLQVEAEVGSQGRRKDIQADFDARLKAWEEQEGEKGEAPKPPLIVKLTIGGSGDGAWRTACNIQGVLTDKELAATKQHVGKAQTTYYTGTREHNWNFAGPGGPDSGSLMPGASDTGPNSIANLVENATSVVAKAVTDAMQKEDRPIVILIKGHSRGAVAAGRIANKLKEAFPGASVELTQVDPVPGPGQVGENQHLDVSGIDESTVVYGVYSGHSASFTPQQVLGAKRIIVSQQAHGVGIQNGFKYGERIYKGSSLNSLPAGVYRDQNADLSVAGELELVGSAASVRKLFVEVYAKRYPPKPGEAAGKSGKNWDLQRKERIEAALEQHAAELDEAEWEAVCQDIMMGIFRGSEE